MDILRGDTQRKHSSGGGKHWPLSPEQQFRNIRRGDKHKELVEDWGKQKEVSSLPESNAGCERIQFKEED